MDERFKTIKKGRVGTVFCFYTNAYGYICVHFPSKKRGFFLYFSPDASLSKSTFYIGEDNGEQIKARMRKEYVGHNWLNKITGSISFPAFEKEAIFERMDNLNEESERIFKTFQLYGRRYRHQNIKRKIG